MVDFNKQLFYKGNIALIIFVNPVKDSNILNTKYFPQEYKLNVFLNRSFELEL